MMDVLMLLSGVMIGSSFMYVLLEIESRRRR